LQTRTLNMDGTPRSAIVSHGSFRTPFVGSISLAAATPCSFGALASAGDAGCQFARVDIDGNSVGAPTSLNGYAECYDLGPSPGGFSFVSGDQGAPTGGLDLVTLATGGSRSIEPIQPPRAYGDRLVLPDESFLLPWESEVDAGELVATIAHYDPSGTLLAPPASFAWSPASRLLLARTNGAVLAAFAGRDTSGFFSTYVVQLTPQGTPLTTPSALTDAGHTGPLSLDSSASGDAVITWNGSQLFVMELDPRGVPRGPATALGEYVGFLGVHVLVGEDGDHALVVYSGEPHGGDGPGVYALPLVCAAH
jgi:hypothetical protein